MSQRIKLRILSYDISESKRRRRAAAILEDLATRVQYSVFEARLTDAGLSDLIERLGEVIDASDNLRVYTIGRSGEQYCSIVGRGIPVDRGGRYWLM